MKGRQENITKPSDPYAPVINRSRELVRTLISIKLIISQKWHFVNISCMIVEVERKK
mgnify:CR=1 FL=1